MLYKNNNQHTRASPRALGAIGRILPAYNAKRPYTHGNRDPARHGGLLLPPAFEPCGRIFSYHLQTAARGPTSLTSENGLD